MLATRLSVLLLATATITVSTSACGRAAELSAPTQQPTASRPAPAPAPAPGADTTVMDFHITGTVTGPDGQPLSNAEVVINYGRERRQYPVLTDSARTDSSGRYDMRIRALRDVYSLPGLTEVAGLAFAEDEAHEYETNVQYVVATSGEVVWNYRLAPKQRIAAGEATTVTFTRDTTFCLHDADDMLGGYICTFAYVDIPTDGLLTVTASPDDGRTPAAWLASVTTPSAQGTGTITFPVKAHSQARIAIELQFDGVWPRSFTVSTSLKPR